MAILIVVDGMGDRPVAEFDGKTPLEAADTPTLDRLASEGATGLVDVVRPGVPPGSDTAHLALFGFDPYDDYTGRGAFEALGAGLEVEPGDVAFRGNFATVQNGAIVDRRAGRNVPEGKDLAALLDGMNPPGYPDVTVRVKHTTQHRCAVVLKGAEFSRAVGDTDPHRQDAPVKTAEPLDDSEAARFTADVLNATAEEFARRLGESRINDEREEVGRPPANHLLVRGAGVLPDLESLEDRFGVTGRYVAPVALYRGLAEAAGLKPEPLPKDVTAMSDLKQIEAETEAAVRAAEQEDFIFIHVKGADNASHDRDPTGKRDVLEAVDTLVEQVRNAHGGHVALTADHTTPSKVGNHAGDPVPLLLHGPQVRTDASESFGERSCGRGGLNRIRGRDVIYELMNLEGRVSLHGE